MKGGQLATSWEGQIRDRKVALSLKKTNSNLPETETS
jgi:hypothetical protein